MAVNDSPTREVIGFLSTLFAATPEDAVVLLDGDAAVVATTNDEILDFLSAAAQPYVRPLTNEGNLAFYHTVQENTGPDDWQDMTVAPSAVLYKDGTAISFFALDQAYLPDYFQPLYAGDGSSELDSLPLPGEWTLVHQDDGVYYTFDALAEVFGTPATDTPPWEHDKINDAVVMTPIDLDSYTQPMTISIGMNRLSTKWRNETMSVGQFVAVLSNHPIGKEKDGPGFVLAEIIGSNRRKQAVKVCYGVGLDIDVGLSGAEIDAQLAQLGCLAVRYTTFSHKKTTSKFNKDRLTKWCNKKGIVFDKTALARFLKEEEEWVPAMIESAEYTGDEHEETGLMAIVTHAPMEKHRIVLPLAEPFVPTQVAATHEAGMNLWGDICRALGRLLGDLPIDKSATDPSRLFYFPRHAKNRPHETSLFGGPLFDWRNLDLDIQQAPANALEAALVAEVTSYDRKPGKGRSTTEEGKNLGRWAVKAAHGFQIVDVIRDYAEDRIRTNGSQKIDIECPFDEDHSNPGDPEDRGCFAVNAGDGPSEIFTIKCQHDSCHGRTNLDFLGKMLKDQWFGEEVLEDGNYNASAPEDAPNPAAATKIASQDEAREEFDILIDSLTEDSPDADVEVAMRAVLAANPSPRARQRAEAALKKILKINQTTLNKLFKEVQTDLLKERNDDPLDTPDPKGRRVFLYQGEYHFDEAADACFGVLKQANLNRAEPVYSCVQDRPVRLSRDKAGRVNFEELTSRSLWAELNSEITFVRRHENSDGARAAVPKEVGEFVYEQAYATLPQAPEIIYTPIFTRDGSLVVQPGYYEELGLLMPDTGFEFDVPYNPTEDEAYAAMDFLRYELLCDFPFLDFDVEGNERREPSEANALAMIITPFMRRMINGCTPVFFIAKPTPGTGGTLLGRVPMLIFDGADSAPMRYTQNEEEMQKGLLAAIIETRSHLFFDDVKDFNNRSLLQSITALEIGGRLLGSTRNLKRPNVFNWVATGNNPLIGSEMERRLCWVRLNRKVADIQSIKFTHDDLPGWIAQNRSKIVSAILTVIQYWIDCGQPMFMDRKRVSFEDWSRKVGGVLQVCGVEGFLDNKIISSADIDESATKDFVKAWLKKFAFQKATVGQLFTYATDMGLDVIEGNNDDQKKSRFPKRLRTMEGRVFPIDGVDYMVLTSLDNDQNLVYMLTALETLAEEAA